ncbi:MAG: integrase family protein, partial [Xanthobacteraceae bacterium]
MTELAIRKLQPRATAFQVWDTHQRGLALRIEPTGYRAWKVIYNFHNRTRWYHIGAADAVGLADARKLAAAVMLQVVQGTDPQAQKRAQRSLGTFEELAERYRDEYAQRRNKSWRQADALVRRHLLPRWAKLKAAAITRADVKATLAKIESVTTANQTLAAASAIFSWALREDFPGVTVNPCSRIERTATKSRERVLGEGELRQFWQALDSAGQVPSMALKTILLTGQRPGEVVHMRWEHIADGWWTLPGDPQPQLGWPGTKNAQTHRVWLPQPLMALLHQWGEPAAAGFVFPGSKGRGPVANVGKAMHRVCTDLGLERVTPHDLRRTHGST